MSESQTEPETDEPGGVLVCESCGETFPVADGMTVLIDHFEECGGE